MTRTFGLLLALAAITCAAQPRAARFTRQISWTGHGTWLKAELHVHTRFSDGQQTVDNVVTEAIQHGCDVIAITDHSDEDLRAATPEYEAAIAQARRDHPSILIIAGVEWNVPPWGGDEHANVLVPAGPHELDTLAAFKAQFDDLHRPTHEASRGDDGLRWLAGKGEGGILPVVIYNHPSRKDAHSIENVADIVRWRAINDIVVGFEGGPGHQRTTPLGSYQYQEKLIDRWDPAVARVGDAWDTLLGRGIDLWGASTGADFHNEDPKDLNDFPPGAFAATWVYAPERTVAGVLRALRAGSFFGEDGHIAKSAELLVDAPGLERPAVAGEAIAVAPNSQVTARLRMEVPATDWQGQPNRIDAVELIAIAGGSASIVATRAPKTGGDALAEPLAVPSGGLVVRVRGRRVMPGGSDLMFYTNPIRIEAVR
jgi:hypothetical protein